METLTKEQIKSAKRVYDSYIKFLSTFLKSSAFLSYGIQAVGEILPIAEEDFTDESIESLLNAVCEYGMDCIDITETVLNQEWFYLRGTDLYDDLLDYHNNVIDIIMDAAYADEADQITDVESLYAYADESDYPEQLAADAINVLDSIIDKYIPRI